MYKGVNIMCFHLLITSLGYPIAACMAYYVNRYVHYNSHFNYNSDCDCVVG